MPFRTLLVAGLCFAAATALAEERGHLRGFRDWIVGCDNTRTCRAFGLTSRSATRSAAVRIDRSGEPDAAATLTIILAEDAAPAAGTRLRIVADGADAVELVIGSGATIAEGELTLTEAETARRLLDAIRRGRSLVVAIEPDPTGMTSVDSISLDGAMAALWWMDERQKRIGTVTALARPGSADAAGIPHPPLAPPHQAGIAMTGPAVPAVLPAELTAAVIQAFRTIPGDGCNQEDDNEQDVKAERLSQQQLLVSIRCWRGAYNYSRAYYIVADGARPGVRPAAFPRIREPMPAAQNPPSNRRPANILWNAEIDAESGTISHLARGRGMADCGEIGVWRWDGERFKPVQLAVMPACRGLFPPNWLTLFRTR